VIRKGDYIQLESVWKERLKKSAGVSLKSGTGRKPCNSAQYEIVRRCITDFENRTFYGLRVDGGVSYDSDLDKVEQVIVEVATAVLKNNAEGVKDFTPSVKFKNFGDSNINFSVY